MMLTIQTPDQILLDEGGLGIVGVAVMPGLPVSTLALGIAVNALALGIGKSIKDLNPGGLCTIGHFALLFRTPEPSADADKVKEIAEKMMWAGAYLIACYDRAEQEWRARHGANLRTDFGWFINEKNKERFGLLVQQQQEMIGLLLAGGEEL